MENRLLENRCGPHSPQGIPPQVSIPETNVARSADIRVFTYALSYIDKRSHGNPCAISKHQKVELLIFQGLEHMSPLFERLAPYPYTTDHGALFPSQKSVPRVFQCRYGQRVRIGLKKNINQLESLIDFCVGPCLGGPQSDLCLG